MDTKNATDFQKYTKECAKSLNTKIIQSFSKVHEILKSKAPKLNTLKLVSQN